MNIVIINDFSLAKGGATGLAILSAKKFVSLGNKVVLICGDCGNVDLAAHGITVIALNQEPLRNVTSIETSVYGLYNLKAASLLERYIKDYDTQDTLYHVHGWAQILSPSIFRALKVVSERLVIHAHDHFLACPNGVFLDYGKQQPCFRLGGSLGCIVKNCDKRSYLHKSWRVVRHASLKQSLKKLGKNYLILSIHEVLAKKLENNGYDMENITILRNPVSPLFNKQVPASCNEKIFYVGRLQEEKGIREALQAARHCGIKLNVLGTGQIESELRNSFPEMDFFGWCSHEKISELLVQARAVVMPSRCPEPFGLVVAEALNSGIPVIVNDMAYLSAEIKENNVGFVYKHGSIECLIDAMQEVLNLSESRMAEMSQRCVSVGQRIFHCEDIWISKLLDVYASRLSQIAKPKKYKL